MESKMEEEISFNMDIDVSKEDNFQLVPTINQLPDSTINFHNNLPKSGIQNYVLLVPGAGQSDITIPCEHISYLPAKQGVIPCQQISAAQIKNPILYQDVKQMTQVTGAIEEQSEYDQEPKTPYHAKETKQTTLPLENIQKYAEQQKTDHDEKIGEQDRIVEVWVDE